MHIYLDIETIPGQAPELRDEIAATIAPPGNMKKAETIAKWEAEEKPAAIEEAWRRTAFTGDRGHVVCASWAIDDEPPRAVYWNPAAEGMRVLEPDEWACESEMLEALFMELSQRVRDAHGRRPVWIGHNIRDFDLRFLFHRAVILDVRPSIHLPHDARPGSDSVFDTMTAWAGWGNRISLDRLCRALDIPTKGSELDGDEIDGSKVWDFVRAGRIDDVVTYCRADVERVRAVHRRMTFMNAESSITQVA